MSIEKDCSPNGELRVFAGLASQNLAQEVSQNIGIPLGKMEITRFADGEIDVSIQESIRGKDVFIIQSTCPPVNEHLMELFIIIDAMRRNDARRVVIATPYYGYSRKERKSKPRDPISGKLIADLLDAAGADQILFFELHATALEGFFNIPTTHMETTELLANAFIRYKRTEGKIPNYLNDVPHSPKPEELRSIASEDVVVVAPDVGGARRARNFARYFGKAHFAIIEKRRIGNDASEVLSIIGDVKGHDAIIVDDMVSTGGTMIPLVAILRKQGAKRVFGCITHPIFSKHAAENIQKAGFDAFFVTNTIPLPPEKQLPNIHVVSVGPFLAEVIAAIHNNQSVSEIFSPAR